MNWKRAALGAALLVLALAFAWTVWPTPYRYHQFDKLEVRENRFTGSMDFLRLGTQDGQPPQR